MFNIGLRSLKAFQTALDVTSQNIANVNTPGYSRQAIDLSTAAFGESGNGVSVDGIHRVIDQTTINNLQNTSSSFSASDALLTQSQVLQQNVSGENVSIANSLSKFFSSLQNANSNPSSIATRNLAMAQLSTVADRFKQLSSTASNEQQSVNSQLQQIARQVTNIAQQVAKINEQIPNFSASGGQLNNMLDQRDKLLKDLSEKISFSSLQRQDGTIDIFIGKGNPLVLGGTASTMTNMTDPQYPESLQLAMVVNGALVPMNGTIAGGQAAGLINYRDQVLKPFSEQLGLLALNISEQFNNQNALGMDLNGNLGSDLISNINDPSLISERIIPNLNNTGTASLTATIDQASQLTGSDYLLNFTSATNYTITRLSDNVQVGSGAIGGLPTQVASEGFTINLNSGTLNTGDNYVISPTRNGAQKFSLTTTNPAIFALASPVNLSAATQNTGNGIIGNLQMIDTSTSFFSTPGQLSPPLQIQFLSNTSYQIINANTSTVMDGPISYNPNILNNVFPSSGGLDPGFRVQLSGNPQIGDIFNITYNSNGVGDNSNGLALTNLQNKTFVNNGQMSFNETFNNTIAQLANHVNSASISQESNKIVFSQAQATRDSISGVNLDEETVNLLKFQKAYEASATVISTANSLFTSLLNIARGQ